MHLVGAGEVVIGRGNDAAMGVFQPVEPCLKPFHGNAAQVDNIAAHGFLVRGDQGAHHVLVVQNGVGLGNNTRTRTVVDLGVAAHVCLVLFLPGRVTKCRPAFFEV